VVDAMRAEADRICTAGVTPDEVQRVRNKRKTSLAVEGEVPYHRLTQLMDDLEYHGAPRTVEERMREVEDITVDSIGSYLQEFPINSGGHLASVGPRNWPELARI
jgi:predicted Zn-dependent peptidase